MRSKWGRTGLTLKKSHHRQLAPARPGSLLREVSGYGSADPGIPLGRWAPTVLWLLAQGLSLLASRARALPLQGRDAAKAAVRGVDSPQAGVQVSIPFPPPLAPLCRSPPPQRLSLPAGFLTWLWKAWDKKKRLLVMVISSKAFFG